jgi:hypothetical protein
VRLAVPILAVASCVRAEIVPAPELPSLVIAAPINEQRVAFDEPFAVSATAVAPEGASILGVELELRGAIDDRRRIDVDGSRAEISVELVVSSDGRLGPDRLPLEIVLTPEAMVDGAVVRGARRSVVVAVEDRVAPELEVAFAPGIEAPPGFDAAYPQGASFSIRARATDPVGGIARIVFDAPAILGGPRERIVPPAHVATFDVVYSPPANADLRLVIAAEDTAVLSNRTERVVRVRIGAGGVDEAPPELRPLSTGTVECGAIASFGVVAEDVSSGIEHVTVRRGIAEQTAFGPDRANPRFLSVSASAPAPGPPGERFVFDAEAEDTFGNLATASFSRAIADTRPPMLATAAQASPFVPGSPLDLIVLGEEACGLIDRVRLDFGGVTATVAIGEASIAGLVTIEAPEKVCVLEPATATVELIDLEGLASNGATLALSGIDELPPRLRINAPPVLAPGMALATEVTFEDGQTPVRSATIAVTSTGLDLPDPLLAFERAWPSASCADRVPRLVPIDFMIPADVRFTAPVASVHIEVAAEDAAGNPSTAALDIPVVDGAGPLIVFVTPDRGSIFRPGDAVPLEIMVADPNRDVASLMVMASGPLSIGSLGNTTEMRTVNAPSATLTFDLLVPSTAQLGSPIAIEATAIDSGGSTRIEELEMSICGRPSVVAIDPDVGPDSGGTNVTIRGSAFAPGAVLRVAGTILVNQVITSSATATGRISSGNYPLGPADVSVTNDCDTAVLRGTLTAGYTFN